MLANHAPLVIAEQFGTLESLYPGRIDLGLGRAPGTEPVTARALRRMLANDRDRFPHRRRRADGVFRAPGRTSGSGGPGRQACRADLHPRLEFGAKVAATLGLPFAFASHFHACVHDAGSPKLSIRIQGFTSAR